MFRLFESNLAPRAVRRRISISLRPPLLPAICAAPFDQAMQVGYYGGAAIFLEPMVSRATLMARQGFDGVIPLVPNPPEGVRFPASLRAEYDAAAEAYR